VVPRARAAAGEQRRSRAEQGDGHGGAHEHHLGSEGVVDRRRDQRGRRRPDELRGARQPLPGRHPPLRCGLGHGGLGRRHGHCLDDGLEEGDAGDQHRRRQQPVERGHGCDEHEAPQRAAHRTLPVGQAAAERGEGGEGHAVEREAEAHEQRAGPPVLEVAAPQRVVDADRQEQGEGEQGGHHDAADPQQVEARPARRAGGDEHRQRPRRQQDEGDGGEQRAGHEGSLQPDGLGQHRRDHGAGDEPGQLDAGQPAEVAGRLERVDGGRDGAGGRHEAPDRQPAEGPTEDEHPQLGADGEHQAAHDGHRQPGEQEGLGVPAVGQAGHRQLHHEADGEGGGRDRAEAPGREVVGVLQLGQQREDDAVRGGQHEHGRQHDAQRARRLRSARGHGSVRTKSRRRSTAPTSSGSRSA